MEITKGMIQLPAPGGSLSALLARPRADARYPGVVVVQEAFGLNQHIKDVACRIAAEGYAVVAPDLYYREQGAVVGYDDLQEAIRLMMTLSDDNVIADMKAVVDYLKGQPFTHPDRVGVTGFCMGGRVSFLTACRNPDVKAAVPFYGGRIGRNMQTNDKTPKAPLEYAASLAAPMLLFFGEDDSFIALDEVELIKRRLAELGKQAETVVYPGAPHGFFCEERPSYQPDAAKDA